LLLILLAFGLTVLCVDPLRETPMEDDWAYAWTVRNLLETGRYQLHDWLSANMPFQAWWGALAATLAGFSFGVLRVSTLALAGIGLVAFYLLAREHGLGKRSSCLLTLVLWSSPLHLRFSFNFMTDVPFTSLFTLALLLYSRALRSERHLWMIAGSLAAAACILTRQFGVALIAALAASWLLRDRRWQRLPFHLAGVVAPAVATLWQLHRGLVLPNWAARYSAHLQAEYLSDPGRVLLDLVARPAIVLQYLALFCAPLVLAAALALRGASGGRGWRQGVVVLVGSICFVLGGSLVHYLVYDQALMPLLPWNFNGLNDLGTAARAVLTLFTAIGAALFGRIFLLRSLPKGWASLSPAERLLDLATLFALGLTLVFVQVGDEYLLVCLPYTLIVVGRDLEPVLERRAPWLLAATAAVLLGAGLWTRSLLIPNEAAWRVAADVHAQGVPAERIWADWMWVSYHHFDDYASQVDPTRIKSLGPSYGNWIWRRFDLADHFVLLGEDLLERARRQVARRGDRMEIVAEYAYRALPGGAPGRVYLVRRIARPRE
jgi:4-amino-4-deoxy-L-arabinose transferase-like glycosyltransferase